MSHSGRLQGNLDKIKGVACGKLGGQVIEVLKIRV